MLAHFLDAEGGLRAAAAEHAAGHVPGARHIPAGELAQRLDELGEKSIDLTGRRALVAGVADDAGYGFAIAKALDAYNLQGGHGGHDHAHDSSTMPFQQLGRAAHGLHRRQGLAGQRRHRRGPDRSPVWANRGHFRTGVNQPGAPSVSESGPDVPTRSSGERIVRTGRDQRPRVAGATGTSPP